MTEGGEKFEAYSGSRVLVTGAYGFIGRHVCAKLVTLGAEVHAVSRQAKQAADGIAASHQVDLASEAEVARLVESVRPDYVFHLASRVSGARSIEEIEPTFHGNLASTVHLLRYLSGTSCRRIVLAGSLEESGDAVPSSPYAAAKAAASMYARMFFELYKTPVTIARLFMVYGPGQHDVRKLVPYVTISLLAGKRTSLSSGVRPVDWVYIDDVAQTLLCSALAPELLGKVIDIGTGQLTTVRSVAERIGKLVGTMQGPVFGAIEDRAAEQVRAADPTAAARLLDRPLTLLDDGLRKTVDWYRERISQGEIDQNAVD